jgi:hypothetical protein
MVVTAIRPKLTLVQTNETSELLAKADFETSTGADHNSAPWDRILGSLFWQLARVYLSSC